MDDSHDREVQVFADALARPAEDRVAFLEEVCGDDLMLRRRVDRLLEAHEAAGEFLTETPSVGLAGGSLRVSLRATTPDHEGQQIGRYRLVRKLGEGSSGAVWLAAAPDDPGQGEVALKILKLAANPHEVIARFAATQPALTAMNHPQVARTLEAGITPAGQPFFVMELVRGPTLTAYCDEHRLPLPARLELFRQVCQGVQHAHQKGVIHGDLQPSRILVALSDGAPVPQVAGFGLAPAVHGRLADATSFHAIAQFTGAAAYRSPEQTEPGRTDVDARSDIYSLGVLLYELLAGCRPFEPKDPTQDGAAGLLRQIREVAPPPPSARLADLGNADREAIARRRSTTPARLPALLRGDLDWIVQRCLEKDRDRRYETAAALAADVARHLDDEPVVAGPPGRAYRIGKFLRRHRLATGLMIVAALALLAGAMIGIGQARRAARAEQAEALARQRAVGERMSAEELSTFMLGDLRNQLGQIGRLDLLDAVADRAMNYFAARDPQELSDPLLARHARALTQIGEIRLAQARFDEATASFTAAHRRAAALAARHPQDAGLLFARAQAEYWNGFAHWKRGQLPAAVDWMTRYRDSAAALARLDPAQPRWRSELADGTHNLAVLAIERGEFDRAREGFETELAQLALLHPPASAGLELGARVADAHSWLGGLAEQRGDFAAARRHYLTETTGFTQLAHAAPDNLRWRYELATAHATEAGPLLVTGQLAAAADQLDEARRLLGELTLRDPSNRNWAAAAASVELDQARLAHARGDEAGARKLLDIARPQFDTFSAADPSDRRYLARLATAWRLEAQWTPARDTAAATEAAARAVDLGEQLLRGGHVTDADWGEAALAHLAAAGIAVRAGDKDAPPKHLARAAELLAPRIAGSRDWHLLDPAARAAALAGRTAEARALVARLNALSYVPLDPWPAGAATTEGTPAPPAPLPPE